MSRSGFFRKQAEQAAKAERNAACPDCGHLLHRHTEQQFWPEGTCNECRREMSRFNSGNPRPAEDVCKHTTAEVRALLRGDA